MKNSIKNLIAVGILSSVVLFGASTAKAGLLMSDFASPSEQPCQAESADSDFAGLLISDLVSMKTGLIMSDRSGLLMSDRTGLIMSDLVSDPNQTENCH